MVTKLKSPNIDLTDLFDQAQSQFRGLNLQQPGQWPLLPKLTAAVFVSGFVVALGWFSLLQGVSDELESARNKEPALKADYVNKLAQAVNLSELRKQKTQVEEYVNQLEKQLPGKAEMDALLSDINQAGLGRGLQFDFFRPGQVLVRDYYAELPISIKVTGRYHDLGAFAADISNLSRIVTLHNIQVKVSDNTKEASAGLLSMEATARTYRYLDPAEVLEQKKVAAEKKNKDAGGKK